LGSLLVTQAIADACAAEFVAITERTGVAIQVIPFPDGEGAELAPAELSSIEAAYASPDLFIEGGTAWRFLDILESLPDLRWVHLGFAGIDHPRFGALLDAGVRLSNSPGAAAEPIAHSAMAGLLSLARRLPYFAASQRERIWQRLPPELIAPDLSTQTLVIFGLGAIGAEIARLAGAFGIHVIGVRRHPPTPDDPVDELVHPDDLDAVLPRADWLVVTANLTSETRGAISAERIALLPRGAHVLNVARGAIVDQDALTAALQSGALAGAYLDVFAPEPLPADSPLWDMPNVLISPHNSWAATGNPERARQIFLTNLEYWLRGDALPQEVVER
jgi:phosphoglycerate dehydrogenase-like enzyme